MKPILYIIMILVLITSASATDYYYCKGNGTNGDDANDCSTPALACKTVIDMNTKSLVAGDNVLFCKGGRWDLLDEPSVINDLNGNSSGNITYMSYGTGAKPIFTRSINDSTWTNLGSNIWKSDTTINDDVGLIIFNNDSSFGIKHSTLVGIDTQGDFFYNSTDDKTYLYSASNPSTYYTSIELSKKGNIFDLATGAHNIVIRDLDLRYSAKDAVFINSDTSYIYIINNSISWIGGAYQSGSLRYGNCLEVVGAASKTSKYIYFLNNNINQCYDAGVSWQSDTTVVNSNFSHHYYDYNIISNTRYCYEFFQHNSTSTTNDMIFDHNTCINSGGGFAGTSNGKGIRCGIQRGFTNITVTNNIFYNSTQYGIEFTFYVPFTNTTYNNNLFYEDNSGDVLVYDGGTSYHYTAADFSSYQGSTGLDSSSALGNPTFVSGTYQPDYNSPACAMSNTGSYVGALPCANAPTPPITNILFKIGNINLKIGSGRLWI